MKKATEALAAESEAAALEGILSPTTEQMRLLRRYKQLKARADAIKTEMSAIKTSLVSYLDKNDARSLTVNGKNWVLVSDITKTIVDTDGLTNEFPTLAADYSAAVSKYTQTVKVPRGRVTIDPR